MKIAIWSKKLGAFLQAVEHDEVRINKNYQRSGKVWPLNAKSYLVETVILGYALPRLMLHRVPGRRGASGHIAIVDGQQRTAALRAFRNDEFRLSAIVDREGLRNKRYSTLDRSDRAAFDDYLLHAELFEEAKDKEIHEVFRRINSYTVPLNPEEQRHARFQGDFKWFIHKQAELHGSTLATAGAVTEKGIRRMADAKLITEICHALLHGVTTTDARALKRLYSDYDRRFDLDRDFARRLHNAITRLARWGPLPRRIAKHFHAYSILLTLMHAQSAIPGLTGLFARHRSLRSDSTIVANLTTLASMLDYRQEPDVPDQYQPFYRASDKGTNVKAAREERCRWYYRALTRPSI